MAGRGTIRRTRLVAGAYFALDDEGKARGTDNIIHYYGAPMGPVISGGMPGSPGAVRDLVSAFEDAGCHELILWPSVPEVDQVERLADIVQ